MLLNKQQITEEIEEEIKKYLETKENENTTIQSLPDTKQQQVYSDTILPQETRKTANT